MKLKLTILAKGKAKIRSIDTEAQKGKLVMSILSALCLKEVTKINILKV